MYIVYLCMTIVRPNCYCRQRLNSGTPAAPRLHNRLYRSLCRAAVVAVPTRRCLPFFLPLQIPLDAAMLVPNKPAAFAPNYVHVLPSSMSASSAFMLCVKYVVLQYSAYNILYAVFIDVWAVVLVAMCT